jgi:hypothetical protein
MEIILIASLAAVVFSGLLIIGTSWFVNVKMNKRILRLKATKDLMERANICCFRYNIKVIDENGTLSPEEDAYKWFYEKLPGFNDMANSKKPILLESFMSKDLLKRLYSKQPLDVPIEVQAPNIK